jgi:hypothetical protein
MRIVFALGLFMAAILLPWYVFMGLALIYAFRYFAPEVLLITLCVDSYFGASMLPHLTMGMFVVLVVVEWYKTFSSFYNA